MSYLYIPSHSSCSYVINRGAVGKSTKKLGNVGGNEENMGKGGRKHMRSR